MRAPFLASLLVVSSILVALPGRAEEGIASGDEAWRMRAEGLSGRIARPDRIGLAIRSYRQSVEAESSLLEARWKLLRSLHYLVEFTDASEDRKDRAVEEAVAVANSGIESLGDGPGHVRDKALVYFWSAIVWGARGQRVGLLTIVREGLAGRIHDYAQRALELAPEIERGGSYRLLSRLHAELPRIPFVSGWVDRDQTLPMAEQAFATDPTEPGNRLILALALAERAPGRRAEAVSLLESVARSTPRTTLMAEDLAIREQARERLEVLRADSL